MASSWRSDGGHLVTNGHDLLFGSVRAAAAASQVFGLAFFLAFKGVAQQPFDLMLFQDGFGGWTNSVSSWIWRLPRPGAGVRANSSAVARCKRPFKPSCNTCR